jgi:HEAT repeat protein
VVLLDTPEHQNHSTQVRTALSAAHSSTRLRAALAAGTHPDPVLVEPLVERCAIEPDFFVRDMLTWALTRHPAELTVPRLLAELRSDTAQARSQALHTLSKIGDGNVWPEIPAGMMHDADDEVARSAWRAAVVLVPLGQEGDVATDLATELGRGDRDMQRSLSRALIALDETVLPAILDTAMASSDPAVRAHARATQRLWDDPGCEFTLAVEDAKRVANAGAAVEEGR